MKRLKIALVAHDIHFRGGMERQFAELVTAICRDHCVHLFTSCVDNVPFEHVTVHHVPVTQKPFALKFAQFYLRSGRLIDFDEFDIVHTIGGITPRQNVVSAVFCQYAWGDVIKHNSEANRLAKPYHKFMWRFTGYFERKAMTESQTKLIGANSQRTADDLERFYGCSQSKIRVIYNGVDWTRFHPGYRSSRSEIRRRYSIGDEDLVVLFVGEYRRKGLSTLIKALSLVKEPRAKILAVGKGNKDEYTVFAKSLGVKDKVILADPAKDIELVYAASDLFAFPTYYEPFGMVITEAMATGIPVVTSRTAGASEMFSDGVSCILLQNSDDPAELAKHIDRLLSDSTLRTEMGQLGRQAVIGYDWKRVAQETLKLYAEVVGDADQISNQLTGAPAGIL